MKAFFEEWSVPDLVYVMLLATLALGFVRLLRGPDAAHRLLALELISVTAVGVILTTAIVQDEAVLLDAAIVIALVAFLGTVTFARGIERSARGE